MGTLRAQGKEEPYVSRLPGGHPGHWDSCGQPASEELQGREAAGPRPWPWLDVSSPWEGREGQGKQPREDREGTGELSKGTDILGSPP